MKSDLLKSFLLHNLVLLCFLSLITWSVSDVQIVECHDQMVGRESNRAWGNEEEKQGENSARAKELFPCKRLVA